MKVRVTFDFDETDRLALSDRMGRDHPATHDELENHVLSLVSETWTDYRHEYLTGQSFDEDDEE